MTETTETIKNELQNLISRGHDPETIWGVPSGRIGACEAFALTDEQVEEFARRWELEQDAFPGEGRTWVMRQIAPSSQYL